jgi:hypothetical protein
MTFSVRPRRTPQQVAGRIGELESRLENTMLERDDLKNRVTALESQKYLREFNL